MLPEGSLPVEPHRAADTAQAQGSPRVLDMTEHKACIRQSQGHWDMNTAQCSGGLSGSLWVEGWRALWIPMGGRLVLPHLGYP